MLALFELECEFAEWLFGEAIFSMPVSDPDGELTANPPPDLEEEVSENGTTYEGPYAIPPAAPVCTGGQVDKAGSCACPEGTVLVSGTCEKPPEKTPPAPPPSPPANPQPAAPGAQPCSCGKLTVYLTHFITSQATGSTRVEFDVNWTMTCTAGTGNCNGQVKILAPLGARFIEQDGELTYRPAASEDRGGPLRGPVQRDDHRQRARRVLRAAGGQEARQEPHRAQPGLHPGGARRQEL